MSLQQPAILTYILTLAWSYRDSEIGSQFWRKQQRYWEMAQVTSHFLNNLKEVPSYILYTCALQPLREKVLRISNRRLLVSANLKGNNPPLQRLLNATPTGLEMWAKQSQVKLLIALHSSVRNEAKIHATICIVNSYAHIGPLHSVASYKLEFNWIGLK